MREVFGSGTAAVVSSLSMLHYQGTDYEISGGKAGPLTQKFFETLTAIQYGAAEDPHGWRESSRPAGPEMRPGWVSYWLR